MAYKKLKLWFDKELAEHLASKIQAVDKSFDAKAFEKKIREQIQPLELKARVEVFADELARSFQSNYPESIANIIKVLGPENNKETGMFTEYYWIMPFAKYVEKYGLSHFSISMNAIEEITKRNTGEYAIRPFLEHHPQQTLTQMLNWSKSSNNHVRRLASEGLRPRLPWAKKLDQFIQDPTPIFPILENLKDDPSKYVKKSVANCLNDILKDNPKKSKQLIERWNHPEIGKERKWIIKHALRNLLKQKDPWAIMQIH